MKPSENNQSTNFIKKLNIKVNSFSHNLDSKSGYIFEISVIIIYTVCHCILCMYHEGSFDEVHAWNIARDATVYQTIFEVPHCEGHPALWHLLLMPFAKSGMCYQFSIMLVTMLFSIVSVYLIEFRSPFPRIIKILLPFTYFIFYQYGVIGRPYCMMVTAILLVACFYNTKDVCPEKFVASLIFLSATSAFGTAISGGIAGVWLFNICRDYSWRGNGKRSPKKILGDRRLYCLILLLLYAVFLLIRAIPEDAYGAMNYRGERLNGFIKCGLYLLLGNLSDLFLTNTYTRDFLADFSFSESEFLVCCFLGVFLLILISRIAIKCKTLMEFIVPYLFYVFFSMIVYFCVHNSGIPFLLLIYWGWISVEKVRLNANVSENNDLSPKKPGYILPITLFLLFMPLFWNVSSSVIDLLNPYTMGQNEAEFLLDNHLDKYSICVEWNDVLDYSKTDSIEGYDLKHNINMDRLSAYMGRVNFVNWPYEYSLFPFYHTITTQKENEDILASLLSNPRPGILIGEPRLDLIDGEFDLYKEYVEVYHGRSKKTWKGLSFQDTSVIYVRKDIAENEGL